MTLGTVIIVDDEQLITNPLSRSLLRMFRKEKLDYEIITSQSPDEILSALGTMESEPALVISDIMMEPMNGVEFLRSVRARYPNTLLMVLTGYANQSMFIELNEQLELFSYVEKPWDRLHFERAVRNALNLYRRKKLLSQYVPEKIVESVLGHADDDVLSGVELEATILFFDFRDSTSLFSREGIGPQKALGFLNQYFEALIDVLEDRGGVLDKFMGDGLMGLFGVPYPSQSPDRDAQQAVLAALEMRDVVHRLNDQFDFAPLSLGIGVGTGLVLAGNIGTRYRMNYTVLGHAVNLANRLEKLAKPITDGILISPQTYAYVKDVVETRPYPITLENQPNPLTVYEVLGAL